MFIPRWYISTAPSSERKGAPLFALRIFGCSVSAITHAMRRLKRCGLHCRFQFVCEVLHATECVPAVCGLRLLHFRVKPVQRHSAVFAARCAHSERSVADNLSLRPMLPRS